MEAKRDSGGRGGQTTDNAWEMSHYVVSGIVVYGGIGWLLSLWLGHRELLMGLGALVGVVLAIYLVIMKSSQKDSAAQQRKQ